MKSLQSKSSSNKNTSLWSSKLRSCNKNSIRVKMKMTWSLVWIKFLMSRDCIQVISTRKWTLKRDSATKYTKLVEGIPINPSIWIQLLKIKEVDLIPNLRIFLFQGKLPKIPMHHKLEEDHKPLSKQAKSAERSQGTQLTLRDYLRQAKILFRPQSYRLLKSSKNFMTTSIVFSQHSERTQGVGWLLSQPSLRKINCLPPLCSINSILCIKKSRLQRKQQNQS